MLRKALTTDPAYSPAYHSLGVFYLRRKQYAQAEENILKFLELQSDNQVGYNSLGYLYDERRKWKQAEEYYLRAIELKPDYLSPYHNLVLLHAGRKAFRKSEVLLSQAPRHLAGHQLQAKPGTERDAVGVEREQYRLVDGRRRKPEVEGHLLTSLWRQTTAVSGEGVW